MTEAERASYKAISMKVLRETWWFARCSAASLEAICEQAPVRVLRRGEKFTSRGETVTSLCLVVEGILEVSTTTRAGKCHILGHLHAGELMNLVPFIDEQGAIHDALAHTDTAVLLIGKHLFEQLVAAEPALTHRLMRVLCLRSRMAYARLADSAMLTLRQRCASLLLQLASPYGVPRPGGTAITLKLSQEELAFMVGCSRPMINRELKQLESEGAIRKTYSHFIVTDADRLRAIVEES